LFPIFDSGISERFVHEYDHKGIVSGAIYINNIFVCINRFVMGKQDLPPKKNVGRKIKYHDPMHKYMRDKQREYYWRNKRRNKE